MWELCPGRQWKAWQEWKSWSQQWNSWLLEPKTEWTQIISLDCERLKRVLYASYFHYHFWNLEQLLFQFSRFSCAEKSVMTSRVEAVQHSSPLFMISLRHKLIQAVSRLKFAVHLKIKLESCNPIIGVNCKSWFYLHWMHSNVASLKDSFHDKSNQHEDAKIFAIFIRMMWRCSWRLKCVILQGVGVLISRFIRVIKHSSEFSTEAALLVSGWDWPGWWCWQLSAVISCSQLFRCSTSRAAALTPEQASDRPHHQSEHLPGSPLQPQLSCGHSFGSHFQYFPLLYDSLRLRQITND